MEDDKAKLEDKIRNEVSQLFIEEAKIEAQAREQRDRLHSVIFSGANTQIIKVSPNKSNLEVLKARQRLEDKIRTEKLRGRLILQTVKIAFLIFVLTLSAFIAVFIARREPAVYYDINAIKDSLQKSTYYCNQFRVENVVLRNGSPYATLELGFTPLTESDLRSFARDVIKKYSVLRPGENINFILKDQKRIYATVNYISRGNSISVELMK